MTTTIVSPARQRRATLAAIDNAQRAMLPPGWDAGLEHQFGATLTDPRESAAKPCAPGLCVTNNPACDGHCRYLEAAQALGQHRHTMPGETRNPFAAPYGATNAQGRALAKWLIVSGIAAGLALVWVGSH